MTDSFCRVPIDVSPMPIYHSGWTGHVTEPMASVPIAGLGTVLRAAATAAAKGVPFLMVRMGDRELLILEYPRGGSPNAPSSNFPAGWKMTQADIVALQPRLGAAMRDADAVGLVWHNMSITKRLAVEAEKAIGGVPRVVCGVLDFRTPQAFVSNLRDIVQGRRVLCLGLLAASWSQAIARLGGHVTPWPVEGTAVVATEARYEQVRDWAVGHVRNVPGDPGIALVAMGPWGKALCHDLWRAGAVALDLGAGLRVLPAVLT